MHLFSSTNSYSKEGKENGMAGTRLGTVIVVNP
jgi:hypothetical protein